MRMQRGRSSVLRAINAPMVPSQSAAPIHSREIAGTIGNKPQTNTPLHAQRSDKCSSTMSCAQDLDHAFLAAIVVIIVRGCWRP